MYYESPGDQIRRAAAAVIIDGFVSNPDVSMPHKFKLSQQGDSFSITGPCSHRYDDHIVLGIAIGVYSQEHAYVIINPFQELNERQHFLYADPDFPDNLLNFVGFGMGTWMSWWDIFKEEGQLEHGEN